MTPYSQRGCVNLSKNQLLTHVALSVRWECCVKGILLVSIDQGNGVHTGLSLARLGFHSSKWLEMSAAGCFVCLRPYSCPELLPTQCCPSSLLSLSSVRFCLVLAGPHVPLLLTPCDNNIIIFSPFLTISSTQCHCAILVVHRDPGQSDRVFGFNASLWCDVSRREGQRGVGKRAGGDEEEGPQAYWDGRLRKSLGEVLEMTL